MKNYVVSLELAKRLKEAGYPQDGEYWYYREHGGEGEVLFHNEIAAEMGHGFLPDSKIAAAPLATELLERLPQRIGINKTKDFTLQVWKTDYAEYVVMYVGLDHESKLTAHDPAAHDKSLPDALAEMYLWLKENNYL